jgi:hypothetical protein
MLSLEQRLGSPRERFTLLDDLPPGFEWRKIPAMAVDANLPKAPELWIECNTLCGLQVGWICFRELATAEETLS